MNAEQILAALERLEPSEFFEVEEEAAIRQFIADACYDHRDAPEGREYWFSGLLGWQRLEDSARWWECAGAAVALVPGPDANGLHWRIHIERKPTSSGCAELWFCAIRPHAANGWEGMGPSLARAVCAASLRARMA